MKYGQMVMVNRANHPLNSCRGVIYRAAANCVTVLFDREVLYDFTEEELKVCEPAQQGLAFSGRLAEARE